MKLLALVVVAACGSKAPAPETKKPVMEEHHMSPQLTRFHDVISPRWHSDKGAQRMKDTCAAMPDFHSAATAVAAKDLLDAVDALDATCKSTDAAAFETAFEKVHTTFHGLMGEHHEHDEHDDHHPN